MGSTNLGAIPIRPETYIRDPLSDLGFAPIQSKKTDIRRVRILI